MPDELQHGNPAPCALVDLRDGTANGFAILKDIAGDTQYLLIPTARISGIESPELLAPDAPNYFAAAWAARSFVEARAGRKLPRQDISLAVNSMLGRTQNQLHIHIDCIRADVRDALHRNTTRLSANWTPITLPPAGHRYAALALPGETLDGINPFARLAAQQPGAAENMGQATLVVTGTELPDGAPGFIILAGHANLTIGNRANGEELQDHACATACQQAAQAAVTPPPPPPRPEPAGSPPLPAPAPAARAASG